jgi:hypothetical protein
MSEENKTAGGIAGIVETLKNNPKAMYAAIGAVVVVILAIFMGGNDGQIGEAKIAALSVGQSIKIQNPNIGNTVLFNMPGRFNSSDADQDETIVCAVVKPGTTGTVEEEQTVNYIPFVKVTLKDGECQGKTGWMAKVNIESK